MSEATQGDRAHVRVTRSIEADPTSTALLLAGPIAMDLWPGLRRVGVTDGQMLTFGSVRALPPRRTPMAYVAIFETVGPGLPHAVGTLTLGYAGSEGTLTTTADFAVDVVGLERTGLTEPSLQDLVRGFLDNLAEAVESRSDAA
jgi:hypothetical protein